MRRRLLVTVGVLVAMVLVGLGVPLAVSDLRSAVQREFVDRLADTAWFASLAQRPLIEHNFEGLRLDMQRYDQVHGVAVALVSPGRTVLVASRPAMDVANVDRVQVALAKRSSEPYPMVLPWDRAPMLLAEPVLVDGEVQGAMVTVSSTATLREQTLLEWLVLMVAGVVALCLAALAALPVVRWILRPVQRLDAGLAKVASAVMSGAPAEPVADGKGPPELRRLTESFDQMAITVTDALAAQRAFVADASHQLRNPLTALRLRLNNLDGDPETVEAEQLAALEEADRLGEVLDGLLALARAERAPSDLEPLDLDEVLEDRLDAWRVLAEHEGLTLSRVGPHGVRVRVPSGAVETLLDAVLDNAIKFSPVTGEITVAVDRDGDHVLLSVRDQGPGIPPDELDRATDRFWRSPTQANVVGSGLGLAIASSTVRRSGGELTLQLPDEGGLRVLFRLRPG